MNDLATSNIKATMKDEYQHLPSGELPGAQGTTDVKGAGVGTSIINLSAAVLGAGTLGLPYGFAQAGSLVSFILLAGSGILSGFTMHLLSIVSRKVAPNGDATFYRISEAMGSWGPSFVECVVISNVFGLATSYLVVFGSTMPYVVGTKLNTGLLTNTHLWVSIGLVTVMPLAFQPTLESLKFTSAAGMVAIVYVVRCEAACLANRHLANCLEGACATHSSRCLIASSSACPHRY